MVARSLTYAARVRWQLLAPVTAALIFGAASAHAQTLLEGPFPFARDNELSIHGGYAAGFGDTFAGPKAIVDYGYKLDRGVWLDLGVGFSGRCRPRMDSPACVRKGDSAEVLAGDQVEAAHERAGGPVRQGAGGLRLPVPRQRAQRLGTAGARGGGREHTSSMNGLASAPR